MSGALWMLLAGALFAGMGVFAKLGAGQFTSGELVFYRSLIGLLALSAFVRCKGWSWTTRHWRVHLARGLSGVVSLGLYFHCIAKLPLATAVTLNYTSPLFLAFFSALFFGERFHVSLLAAIAVSFTGVVLLLEPTLAQDQVFDGLLGLASGMLAAVAYLNIKKLGATGEPGWRIVLYFTLVSSVVAGIWVLLTSGFNPVNSHNVGFILGVGATALVAQIAMTLAYHQGNTIVVGAFSYSTVVFSALLGLVLWRETLGALAWVGIALILIGGLLCLRWRQR